MRKNTCCVRLVPLDPSLALVLTATSFLVLVRALGRLGFALCSSSRQPSTSISSMKDRITPSSFSCCSSLNSISLDVLAHFLLISFGPGQGKERPPSALRSSLLPSFVRVCESFGSLHIVSGHTPIKFLVPLYANDFIRG